MTTTQQGRNNQKRTADLFKSVGFQVHTVLRPSYRGGSHDIFGLWDHIAIASTDTMFNNLPIPAGATVYIQTKSRKIYGKDADPFVNFPAQYKYCIVWEKQKNGRYSFTHQIF